MGRLLLGILLLCNLVAPALAEKPIAPQQLEGVTRVSAEDTIKLILETPALVVIDSRKQEEFSKGHIQGAINLLDTSMTAETLAQHVPSLETPVLFYCNGARCMRSSHAATRARQWGYRNIFWFRGGWSEWQEKQLPIYK